MIIIKGEKIIMKVLKYSIALLAMLSLSYAKEIESIRDILGKIDLSKHTNAQIRMGYINQNNKGSITEPDNDAFAIGGHIHLSTDRKWGFKFEGELYTVQDLGFSNNNPQKVNPDFFDKEKSGFSLLSQALISYKYKNSELKIGRQLIDTPHADSDDIRMMPNYFMGYLFTNKDIENLTLTLGKINQMAGWENEKDSSKFVKISDIFEVNEDTNGIYLASAVYEKDNYTLQTWYYDIDEIADVFYLEAGYEFSTDFINYSLGVQYDAANERGKKLLGKIDSSTWGVSLELNCQNVTILTAYNEDNGDSGAFESLGGGAFFTSLEDQTIDAIEESGKSWIAGSNLKINDNFQIGAVYGKFQADNKENYDTSEIDIVAEYSLKDKISISAVYASIDDKTNNNLDYDIFRIIANYNF